MLRYVKSMCGLLSLQSETLPIIMVLSRPSLSLVGTKIVANDQAGEVLMKYALFTKSSEGESRFGRRFLYLLNGNI